MTSAPRNANANTTANNSFDNSNNSAGRDKESRVLLKAQIDASTESAKQRGEYLGTGISARYSESFDGPHALPPSSTSSKSTSRNAQQQQAQQQRTRPRGLFGAIFGALSCTSSRNVTSAVNTPSTLPPSLSTQSSQRLKNNNININSNKAVLEDAQQQSQHLQLQMPSLDASASDELNLFPHLSTDPQAQPQHNQGRNSPARGSTPVYTSSSTHPLPPHPYPNHHNNHNHNHMHANHHAQGQQPWRHLVTDALLGQFLGKLIDLPVDQCCCLLNRGYVEEKMFSFSWEQLVFDRVYANGKNQICGAFSASVKQHVLTWVDLLGEDGLAQQQTNKFLPDITWRKMQQRAPLHPVEDFAWLNHDFWQSTGTKKPLAASTSSSTAANHHHSNPTTNTNAHTNANVRSDFDFMSFWDIACKYHGAVSERARARVAEDVLIERLWHLLLHIRNACRHYADKFSSIKSFSRSVRTTLLKYAGNMLRLRSFSQQFKADLVNTSAMNALFRRVMPTMRGSTPRGGIADFNGNNSNTNNNNNIYNNPFLSSDAPVNPHSMGSAEDAVVNALHLLQLRMTKMVYILQVREMLLLFHPSSGRDYKQQFGGNAARYPLSPKAGGEGGSNGIAAFHSSTSFPSDLPPHVPSHQALNPAALMLLSSASLSARNQIDWRLSTRESQLLFDFCTQDVDERCGGGVALRAQSLQSMASGVLHGALLFLISCGTPPSNTLHNNQSFSSRTAVGGIGYDTHTLHNYNSAHDTSSNHSESTHDLLRPMRSLLGGMLLSASHHHTPAPPLQQQQQQQSPAATHNAHLHSGSSLPLSLICGLPAHALPWEALVGAADVSVTRSLGVMSLFLQMVSLLCADDTTAPRSLAQSHSLRLGGFQKSLKPVFTLVSSQKTLAESRTQDPLSDLVARIENRRTRSAVQAISALQHPCDHLAILRHNNTNNNNNNSNDASSTSPFSPSGGIAALSTAQAAAAAQRRAQQQRLKLDRVLIQRLRHGLLPLPSLLPQFSHIATLFARGDLLVLPLNFSTLISDANSPPFHLKTGASSLPERGGERGGVAQWETDSRTSDVDSDPLSSEALVPSSALVESECKDLRVEVGLFCKELDHAVASYVRRLPLSQQVSATDVANNSHVVSPDTSAVHRLLSVLILSHCDLVEMNPTTLALLSRTRTSTGSHHPIHPLTASSSSSRKAEPEEVPCQPIVLFAPPCVQEHLLVELKLALDRWHRGDLQLGQSFDYGGGSLYSSSAHSSVHSMSLSPVANNHHGLSTVSLVQPQSSRSSRWPSLRSRSVSIDRLSSGSRGNSKSDLHISVSSATATAAHLSVNNTTNNHNSIGSVNSQPGGILLHNLPSPMAPASHRDSTNSILSASHNLGNNSNNNRSRRSSESEPFSHLDRVESASASHFSAFFFAPRPQSGLSSWQGSDFVASHQRFFRAGSGTSQNSRGNSLQLPPPPPPLSLQLSHLQASPGPGMESQGGSGGGGGDANLLMPALGSPARDRDSDRLVDRPSSPAPDRVISDPCLIVLQVVQRLQVEHAVNITVFL